MPNAPFAFIIAQFVRKNRQTTVRHLVFACQTKACAFLRQNGMGFTEKEAILASAKASKTKTNQSHIGLIIHQAISKIATGQNVLKLSPNTLFY